MKSPRIIALLAIAWPLVSPGSGQFSGKGLESLDMLIDGAINDRRITAAIATLEVDGTVEWIHAVGEMEAGVPMRDDPILPLASVGKMFTATAAMILYERGVIALDDPVSKFIPEFEGAMVTVERDGRETQVPAKTPMTVFHLLTHTGGFVVEGDSFWEIWDAHVAQTTTTAFARDLLALGLQSHPGERFDYGQTGASYEVLGAVIEIASGQTLEEFMFENIFGPLGLEDSYFYLPREKSDRLPAVYRMEDEQLVLDRPAGEDFSRSTFFHGGGGVRSAPADILKFARLFLNGGEVDGVRLLKPETVGMMMQDQLGDLAPETWKPRGLSWGFGAAVKYGPGNNTVPDQYGWVGGGFAKLWVDPQRRMIAYINFPLTPPGDNALLREFEEGVYAALK